MFKSISIVFICSLVTVEWHFLSCLIMFSKIKIINYSFHVTKRQFSTSVHPAPSSTRYVRYRGFAGSSKWCGSAKVAGVMCDSVVVALVLITNRLISLFIFTVKPDKWVELDDKNKTSKNRRRVGSSVRKNEVTSKASFTSAARHCPRHRR